MTVLDTGLYISLNKSMLGDADTYRQLSCDPTNIFQQQLKTLLNEGVEMGALTNTDAEKMFIQCPIIPIFHSLPKVHKGVFPPPLRPIVAGIGSLGERLSAWVDAHLQPLISITPSFIKDTKDLVTILDGQSWDTNYCWVSCDVVALYPSMLHDWVLITLRLYLNTYSSYSNILKEFLVMATQWLLSHNFFIFNREFFLQIRGVPMGGKCSPSLAGIYMSAWEMDSIFSDRNPFASHIRWFGRYIDDVLLMWEGPQNLVTPFVTYINNNSMGLKFTANIDFPTTNFLDLTLTGNTEDGTVSIAPYRKPTSSNSILMADSSHPPHVIKNIPLGELTRLKRNCSNPGEYSRIEESTLDRLKARRYPPWSLNRARERLAKTPRQTLLQAKVNQGNTTREESPVVFSTPYSPQFNAIKNIVAKYLPILQGDKDMADILSRPVKYVARRARTIGNSVSPSGMVGGSQRENWLSIKGFFKCGRSVCKACQFVMSGNNFESTSLVGRKPFVIRDFINCSTKNTIYVISCTECHLQYVGCSSTELKVRIRRHLSDIANVNSVNVSAASRHFISNHNREVTAFKFMGVEKVSVGYRGGNMKKKLLIREAFWMFMLNSRHPDGLNVRQDLRYQY